MNTEPWAIKLLALDKRVKAFAQGYRQNIALLGSDAEETSYLLDDYLQRNELPEITYIRTTTTHIGKKEFFKAMIFSLLSNYTRKTDALDNLINYTSSTLGATTALIKDCLKKNNISFLDVLEVINKFINESNRHCVLIIEEFLRLADFFKDFSQDFSKFIILQRKCMIVLTTSYSKMGERVLSGKLNLLFGNFEQILLDENTSLNNYLYFRRELMPISPSPFFLSFFMNIIGSNVIHYDLIAKAIKNNYEALNEEESIISVVNEALYSKETYFFQRFSKKIDLINLNFKDSLSTIKLLLSLAEGYLRKRELSSLGIYESKELDNLSIRSKFCPMSVFQLVLKVLPVWLCP